MSGNEQIYIPYEATAEATVKGANIDEAVLRIFPDATPSQLLQMSTFVVGLTHDGIEIGIACSDEEPMAVVEAYRFGVEEGIEAGDKKGYQRAVRELKSDGGIS